MSKASQLPFYVISLVTMAVISMHNKVESAIEEVEKLLYEPNGDHAEGNLIIAAFISEASTKVVHWNPPRDIDDEMVEIRLDPHEIIKHYLDSIEDADS
jgi:hypothetical protein